MVFPIPPSCTLPTADRPLRAAEFEALLTSALAARRKDPCHLRVSFAGGDSLATTIRDLATREAACCTFFKFTVSTEPGRVLLDVAVPASRVQVLDGIVGLVETRPR